MVSVCFSSPSVSVCDSWTDNRHISCYGPNSSFAPGCKTNKLRDECQGNFHRADKLFDCSSVACMSSGERRGKRAHALSQASDIVLGQNTHTGHCLLEAAVRKDSDFDSFSKINSATPWEVCHDIKSGKEGRSGKIERKNDSERVWHRNQKRLEDNGMNVHIYTYIRMWVCSHITEIYTQNMYIVCIRICN